MVDFTLNAREQEIIKEIRRQGMVIREKYARYYDDNEKELPPDEFPEAAEFAHIEKMMAERGEDATPNTVFYLTALMHRVWGDFMPMKVPVTALGNHSVIAAGTDEQKKRWANTRLSMANTEPGCGSDSKAITTTAVLDGDEWVLNGEKIFVTTGIRADGMVVWATIDPSAGRGAIKAFVVMKGTPGCELAKKEEKMGIRSSDTAAFVLKDCRVPRENLLGMDETVKKGGGGFKGLMKTFNLTRPGVAAMGIGNLMACQEFVTEVMETEGVTVNWQAGQNKRSAIEEKMIELEAEVEAATLTTYRAAWLADKGKPNNLEASVSKLKGGDISRKSAQLALEILGALSVTHDYLVEKWFRDARITDIYEGTGEIQRLVIARELLGYSSKELT